MAKSEPVYKIGFVLDGGLERPDGVQQYILGLGEWFKSQGHTVRYVVAGKIADGIVDAISLSANVPVIGNGNRLAIPLPASKKRMQAYMKKEKFDVLHVQTPYSPLMGEQLVMLASPKTAVIGTFHILPNNWYFYVGNWLLGSWCQKSLKRFDKMLSVSAAAATFAKRTFRIDSDVLPNVVDYKRFSSARAFSQYKDDTLTILFVGRLVPRKGCHLLLEAVAQLMPIKKKLPKFRVVICGDGPLKAALIKYVAECGLEDIVEFSGFISEADKPRYYASADISVFPSRGGESFGIVLLEALSSGRSAVLAGNNPGYASVMSPKPEQLFNPKDSRDLANKLVKYLSDEQLRRDSARWGKTYAKQFDVSVIGAKLLDVYAKALHERRSQ